MAPVQNAIFCCFLPLLIQKLDITPEDIMVGAAAGTMMETARVLISYSIAVGLAGPVNAIINSNQIY